MTNHHPPRTNAFGDAILPHRALLYRTARRLETSPAAAEDLVHETIARALERSHRFRPGTNLKAWLMTIMRNLFTDTCRRRKLEHPVDPKAFCRVSTETPEPIARWRMIAPGEVQRVVPLLASPLRTTMTLYLAGTRSYDRIGQELGVSVATVGVRMFRARTRMRALLSL